MAIYPQLILDALKHVRYPGNGKDLVEAEMIEDDIRIDGNKVSFSIILQKLNDPFAKSLVKAAEAAILTYVGENVEIKGNISLKTPFVSPTKEYKAMEKVKNIIAVSSGKGGVGKSTVAANLAMAFVNKGYKVGLLDADIFGPSMPKMFGVEDARPEGEMLEGKQYILPVDQYGLKLLSIGFFVDPESAVIWRGAMASNGIKQLVNDTMWGELDYFVVDLPPGTSDIHLTMVDALDFTGAIVVSTPQEVALADAKKGIQMFQNDKIDVPILGLVENMAWFTPETHPEEKYYIFGNGGAKRLAEERNIPLLAQIPLVQGVCSSGDQGAPVVMNPNEVIAEAFDILADKVIEQINKLK